MPAVEPGWPKWLVAAREDKLLKEELRNGTAATRTPPIAEGCGLREPLTHSCEYSAAQQKRPWTEKDVSRALGRPGSCAICDTETPAPTDNDHLRLKRRS